MPLITDSVKQLNEVAASLYAITQDESVADDVWRAANLEFREVNHRLMILMGMKLADDVKGLQTRADKIKEAKKDLDAVLRKVERASQIVAGVTKFLGKVDDFVDFAKKAATKLL